MNSIAELTVASAFSFSEGASMPEELVERAQALGFQALAITDRDGVYGLPRAWRVARGTALRLLSGARITIEGGPGMVLLARDTTGWAHLCQLLTACHKDTAKGRGRIALDAVLEKALGLEAILMGPWDAPAARAVGEAFGPCASVGVARWRDGNDEARVAAQTRLAAFTGIPLVVANDVVLHDRSRKALHDVLTAIRLHATVEQAGRALDPNAERVLRSPQELREIYADLPKALERTIEIAGRCHFTLADLHYRYPREVVPLDTTPMQWLRTLTDEGLAWRYPLGIPSAIRTQVEHELTIIERLDFPAYFLTVYDSVRFARERGILCQGRGSAANSAVCFALGITSVDPACAALLFERFISEERGEPPDIDVDFEHERREEVIQYVYEKYGRHRAGMVNEVIAYRTRSAIRDVGKALGLSLDQVDRLAKRIQWFEEILPEDGKPFSKKTAPVAMERLLEAGLDPNDERVQLTLRLSHELSGFPRHVGIHVGGFTISDGPLVDLVPIEPATMENRTVIQWDKDDIDVVGFVKVDLLALGMLTAIRKCFDFLKLHWSRELNLATVPTEDPQVYDMLCKADSVGVFQVESRAQMSMLPRLRPRCFYDLVIEVSLVRPGPIQGGMVHPYLRRRLGQDPVVYAHPKLVPILERTLGVPIFQEQVMAMAVAVGGFTPGEADQLRRAMGSWRKRGGLLAMGEKLTKGMLANGLEGEYAKQVCAQIQGFGDYGFPESHAASFSRLVYVSAWQKLHFPEAFAAALINSQPMGFYAPRSIVSDAQRHGVEVRPVDVQCSDWDCTLEENDTPGRKALRLGFRLVDGFREASGKAIEAARKDEPFRSITDLQFRSGLDRDEISKLARADALRSLFPNRRQALWTAKGLFDTPLLRGLRRPSDDERPPIPSPTELDELCEDYLRTGLSVSRNPIAMMRHRLDSEGVLTAEEVQARPAGARVKVSGLVAHRQRPGTAEGIIFMTLEDETGLLNLVVKPELFERQRKVILNENLVTVLAKVQRDGESMSLLCREFTPLRLDEQKTLDAPSRDFH